MSEYFGDPTRVVCALMDLLRHQVEAGVSSVSGLVSSRRFFTLSRMSSKSSPSARRLPIWRALRYDRFVVSRCPAYPQGVPTLIKTSPPFEQYSSLSLSVPRATSKWARDDSSDRHWVKAVDASPKVLWNLAVVTRFGESLILTNQSGCWSEMRMTWFVWFGPMRVLGFGREIIWWDDVTKGDNLMGWCYYFCGLNFLS